MAETMSVQIKGLDIGNGVVGRGCFALGRTINYQYDVHEYWIPTENLKEDLIQFLNNSAGGKAFCQQGIDVKYYYFNGNSLVKTISIKSNELSVYHFKLGEYISIEGHPKSKGVNLKLKVPIGWDVVEANRPNVVKKFVYDTNTYLIMIKESAGFMSRNEAKELFADESYVLELVEGTVSFLQNPKVLSHKIITLDNYPTLEITAKGKKETSGVELDMVMKYWFIPYEDMFVILQSGGLDDKSFKDLESLYNLISNSVIFSDQYGN